MQAQTLHCSSCGAAVSQETRQCAHCGARLATMACPGCFGMMFQGSKFCPHCGAVGVQWEGTSTPMPCPRCDEPLLQGRLRDRLVYECGKCFGFWVDQVTFEQICREAEHAAVGLGALGPATGGGGRLEEVRYVRCPLCRQLMHRVNFGGQSGVVVDVCREHGTWFDVDELHRIVQFVRAGGLDRARQRQKAELAHERRRLESARRVSGVEPGPAGTDDLHLLDAILASRDLLGRWLKR